MNRALLKYRAIDSSSVWHWQNFKNTKMPTTGIAAFLPLRTLFTLVSRAGVNFTNILWEAFAPKSFCQKIRNPNFKDIKVTQRALVCLSISPIFYEQLFHTKVLYAAFMCLQFGFLIFWQKDFGAKAAHKMVKLTPGLNCISSPKVAKASGAINTSSFGQGKQDT